MDPHDLASIKSEPLRFTLKTLTPPSLPLITSFLMQILFCIQTAVFYSEFSLTELLPNALPPRAFSSPCCLLNSDSFQVQAQPSLLHMTLLVLLWRRSTVHRGHKESDTAKHACSVKTITHITQSSFIFTWLGGVCICMFLCISLYLPVYLYVKVRIYEKLLQSFLAHKPSTTMSIINMIIFSITTTNIIIIMEMFYQCILQSPVQCLEISMCLTNTNSIK